MCGMEAKPGRPSLTLKPKTQQYWDQVGAFLSRIEVMSTQPEDNWRGYGLHDFTAYFLMAYHVRDYLIHVEYHKKATVDAYVKADPFLSHCRDLSVNLKHNNNTRPMTPDGRKLALDRQTAEFERDGVASTWSRFVIEIDGVVHDARDWAVSTYYAWCAYGMPFKFFADEAWQGAEEVPPSPGAAIDVKVHRLSAPRPEAWPDGSA